MASKELFSKELSFNLYFVKLGSTLCFYQRFTSKFLIICLYYCSFVRADTSFFEFQILEVLKLQLEMIELFGFYYLCSIIFYNALIGNFCVFCTFSSTLSIFTNKSLLKSLEVEPYTTFYYFCCLLLLSMLFMLETDEKLLTALPFYNMGCESLLIILKSAELYPNYLSPP